MLATPPTMRHRAPHIMSKRPTPAFKEKAQAYAVFAAAVTVVAGLMLNGCLPENRGVAQNDVGTAIPELTR